ncbi:MAG: TonB-dependent receptor [Cellvibrionaceae bacterium]|nr:TonB-dependent receptor [Cellvibrionaceae bacterium]
MVFKQRFFYSCGFCCVLPLLPSAKVLGQENSSADNQLEEIIVTATKRDQSIYEVPTALSAFQGDTLAQRGVIDIIDIGKFVPNLNITQFSAGHNASSNPFIRGIGLQDHLITTDPGVSVYVDGVYLGRQVGQNWNLTNIERIEVLRGPQGTLYGRNSIGGAINIITKQPGADPGNKASVEVGSRERVNADFFSDFTLGDTTALSISGGYKSRGGVGEFTTLDNPGVEVGENSDIFGRAAFLWQVNEQFSIVLSADANSAEGGLRPYDTLIDELPNGALFQAGLRNADQGANPYDNATGQPEVAEVSNEASGIALNMTWDVNSNYRVKFIASERSSEYESGLDDDGLPVNFLVFPETGSADQRSIELQLNGDFGSLDFVSGLYSFREEGENNQTDTFFNGNGPSPFYLAQEVNSLAAFFNIGFDATQQLRLSLGMRYTQDEKEAEADVGIGLTTAEDDWDELTWDLSAVYRFANDLRLYGSIQSGYQSGQFPARPFCLFGDPNCFVASENITAVNYEVGLKGQPQNWLQMSAAFFYTLYDELPYQVSSTTEGGFSTSNLVVEQRSSGFEWESTLLLAKGFSLQSALGLIDIEVEEQGGVRPVAPLTPEVTFSFAPEWNLPLASGAAIISRVDYSFRDQMFGEPSDDPGRFTLIDSRELINFNIAYHSAADNWQVAFYGRNIFDEKYDDARLNTGDYVLRMLSNDRSEFGLRWSAQL